MKLNVVVLALLAMVGSSCANRPDEGEIRVDVMEVIQVESYTYLLVQAKGSKDGYWIATPSMEANPGDRFSYRGGMEMTDFYSKELDRTFEKVLFLETLSSPGGEKIRKTPGSKVATKKADVEVSLAEGSVPLSDIFADPGKYAGKSIQVTGVVTRVNNAIMHQNWVHLQDGSSFEGEYELTATTAESFEVGDQVTLEGVLALDRDFGYGYTYDILLETARSVD